MKKSIILFVFALIAIPAFSQVANNTDDNYIDSLAGFHADLALIHSGEAHEAAEAENQIALAKRDFINKKFSLGIYKEGYVPSNWRQHNPVFPVAACTNVDFETGDFTGWAGAIGDNNLNSFNPLSNIQNGIFSTVTNDILSNANARHTVMTTAFGPDPNGGFPVVPPINGGIYSIRLGGTTPNYQGEYIEQTFTVSPTSTSFAYQYACVLNDGSHPPNQQPYFRIEVLDQNGQPISNCTQLNVTAGANALQQGFFQSTLDPYIFYKPWTTVNFDLTAFVNQNVTVRFTVAGCTQSGHWGYAYIDCSCSALAASINFCPGNPFLLLSAPSGYGQYQWLDPNQVPIPGATNDSLLVNNPVVGDTFYVYLVSGIDTSCHNVLPVVLQYTQIYTNATSTDASCYGVYDGSATTVGSSGILPYTYAWNTAPPQNTQSLNNLGPGTYIIHMTDSLGCQAYDTIVIFMPPRQDTSSIIYTFCPGDPDVLLTAPLGYNFYTWIGPNGDTIPNNSNSITITGPQVGTEYTCVLWSPPACRVYDSIILNLVPPVNFFKPDSTTNVFTPNGDLQNDNFYPYFDLSIAQQVISPIQPAYNFMDLYINMYEIWIYDRWGIEVFYANDYNLGWNGKNSKGTECTDGVYYWVSHMTSRCSEETTPTVSKGFVHLIR